MRDCCKAGSGKAKGLAACPRCGQPGRRVDAVTPRALLRPSALARLEPGKLRFCPTASCAVVYFGPGQVFEQGDVAVRVFQKVPTAARTVCCCFDISEKDIGAEIVASRESGAPERIARLVSEGLCASELRNPQGTCCLGNVRVLVRALQGVPC